MGRISKWTIGLLGAAAALTLNHQAEAADMQVRVLTCNVASGFGFIFGSSRELNCTFPKGLVLGSIILAQFPNSASILGIYKAR